MLVGTPLPVNLSVCVALGRRSRSGNPGSNPGGATSSPISRSVRSALWFQPSWRLRR